MNPTHDPTLRSFVEIPENHPFPIQNLPFGVFRRKGGSTPAIGVRIGDYVVDCAVLEERRLFQGEYLSGRRLFAQSSLNVLMGLGRPAWREVRRSLQKLLNRDSPELRDDVALRDQAIIPLESVDLLLPASIGDYTDFYASRQHATNVGTMFRGAENALQPNWLHLPVGYHGRASSIVASGAGVIRPSGQLAPDDGPPTFGPSRLLDFELELGVLIGPGNTLGSSIAIDECGEQLFGMVLVNDWSARDIQKWEYVPLGPFLGKSFATSISPWIVCMEALEPFRVDGEPQHGENPEVLPYLRQAEPRVFDLHLEVLIRTAEMAEPVRIAQTNARNLYWSFEQQVAHHTANGCNLRPGDLLASGTISGPSADSYGSLLELSWRGTRPLDLGGVERRFLEDGDTVILRGWGQGDGYRIGLGDVEGRILPARERQ
jgi:fumarylacetoacetase